MYNYLGINLCITEELLLQEAITSFLPGLYLCCSAYHCCQEGRRAPVGPRVVTAGDSQNPCVFGHTVADQEGKLLTNLHCSYVHRTLCLPERAPLLVESREYISRKSQLPQIPGGRAAPSHSKVMTTQEPLLTSRSVPSPQGLSCPTAQDPIRRQHVPF